MTLFGNENRLYEFCHNPQMMFGNAENITSLLTDASYSMDSLPDNRFSLIVINFDSVKHVLPEILDQCDRLITNNGKLVIYGSGMQRSGLFDIAAQEDVNLYRLNTERAVLSMDITDKKPTSEEMARREQIFNMIDPVLMELSTKFETVLSAHPSHDEWHRTIDHAILLMSRIEEIVAKYYMIFENKDLKYTTNEVKNALLDLKYEAYLHRPHYDYFHSVLIDLYHHWLENIC
jgi:6-pyruvoyl-tetrahydropterin synthase